MSGMNAKRWLMAAAGLIAIGGVGVLVHSEEAQALPDDLTFHGEPVTRQQIERGHKVYADYCASCHGANLEGQPNWKRRLENGRMPAPPHDESGHTWYHSDQDLFAMTKFGVGGAVASYESDMPAFEGVLSDDDIAAVLAFIKSTWPERQRRFQAQVTAKEGDGS